MSEDNEWGPTRKEFNELKDRVSYLEMKVAGRVPNTPEADRQEWRQKADQYYDTKLTGEIQVESLPPSKTTHERALDRVCRCGHRDTVHSKGEAPTSVCKKNECGCKGFVSSRTLLSNTTAILNPQQIEKVLKATTSRRLWRVECRKCHHAFQAHHSPGGCAGVYNERQCGCATFTTSHQEIIALAELPDPDLRSCANPNCGHAREDHHPSPINYDLVCAYDAECPCVKFMDLPPLPRIATEQSPPSPQSFPIDTPCICGHDRGHHWKRECLEPGCCEEFTTAEQSESYSQSAQSEPQSQYEPHQSSSHFQCTAQHGRIVAGLLVHMGNTSGLSHPEVLVEVREQLSQTWLALSKCEAIECRGAHRLVELALSNPRLG